MKEIIERLTENRQLELAKSILESNGYKVAKKSKRLNESTGVDAVESYLRDLQRKNPDRWLEDLDKDGEVEDAAMNGADFDEIADLYAELAVYQVLGEYPGYNNDYQEYNNAIDRAADTIKELNDMYESRRPRGKRLKESASWTDWQVEYGSGEKYIGYAYSDSIFAAIYAPGEFDGEYYDTYNAIIYDTSRKYDDLLDSADFPDLEDAKRWAEDAIKDYVNNPGANDDKSRRHLSAGPEARHNESRKPRGRR